MCIRDRSDILFHPDGFVYVLAHSGSSDGDFDANDGLNDLWMIRLAGTDGDLEHMERFGGSGNDFNGHADFYGDDQIVISVSSTSSDLELTGNKGLADVWVLTTDLNGNILQQMNYGGSLNDLAVDIITNDSIFYLLSSTLSSDKNVPFNSITQQDLWYYSLNPNPDTCSEQFLCQPDSMLTNHIYPPANDALICVSGCTAGYGSGPVSYTHLRAHETVLDIVCRLLLEKQKHQKHQKDTFQEPTTALASRQIVITTSES